MLINGVPNVNHHKVSKTSKNHGVISIENCHKLPSSISEIGNHCEYHNMKYAHFCQHHACCLDCTLANHKSVLGFCLSVK
jgi:hypothetical protein